MAGDVVADCLRLVARLYVVILIADALMVQVLGADTPEEWLPHDRGAKIAALSTVAIYAFWRFLRYRMDSYIASNPLPSADATGDTEDEVQGRGLAAAHPDAAAARHGRLDHRRGRRPAGAVRARDQHHAADRRRLGVRPGGVVRQPVAGARHRVGHILPRRGFLPHRRVCRLQQGQGHGRGLQRPLAEAPAPERPAPYRAVRPGRPHHQFQPRLDGGEVQPRLRPRHRRRAVAQDGEEDRAPT